MCLLILVMASRALIPTGYMPDAGARLDGKIALTFCTPGSGVSTLSIDVGKHHSGVPDQQHVTPDCAFSVLAHQALDGAVEHTGLLLASVFSAPAPASLNFSLPPLPSAGPPLGPRAPPSSLG